jgi:hypothetical protein
VFTNTPRRVSSRPVQHGALLAKEVLLFSYKAQKSEEQSNERTLFPIGVDPSKHCRQDFLLG